MGIQFGEKIKFSYGNCDHLVVSAKCDSKINFCQGGVFPFSWSGSAWVQDTAGPLTVAVGDNNVLGTGTTISGNGLVIAAVGFNRVPYTWHFTSSWNLGGGGEIFNSAPTDADDACDAPVTCKGGANNGANDVELNSDGSVLVMGSFSPFCAKGGIWTYIASFDSYNQRDPIYIGTPTSGASLTDWLNGYAVGVSADGLTIMSAASGPTVLPGEGFCPAVPAPTGGVYIFESSGACGSSPCANGAPCIPLAGGTSYVCTPCPSGYSGINCQTNINECDSQPCMNGATCIDGILSFQCVCMTGYNGSHCETNTDQCANHPCRSGAVCVNGVVTYNCKYPIAFGGGGRIVKLISLCVMQNRATLPNNDCMRSSVVSLSTGPSWCFCFPSFLSLPSPCVLLLCSHSTDVTCPSCFYLM